MTREPIDPIVAHFNDCLVVKTRRDGNVKSEIAKGDCCFMLQLVRMKLDNFATPIDPSNPGRFRGTAGLKRDMRAVLGKRPTFHILKWGASHIRGALRDDAARGNKRHLIRMIELLNEYAGSPQSLQTAYEECIRAHHRFWESFALTVSVQKSDPVQERLLKLLEVRSFGRVQQGLVYSALRRRYGDGRTITTKKTFAGDDQSSRSGREQRGDVQVWSGEELATAIEVKDAIVDQTAWGRVVATHGAHDYALFVLASGFRPRELQREISNLAATYALHLVDFMLAVVFLTATDANLPPIRVLEEIVEIYNNEFCTGIERDASIRIELREE